MENRNTVTDKKKSILTICDCLTLQIMSIMINYTYSYFTGTTITTTLTSWLKVIKQKWLR